MFQSRGIRSDNAVTIIGEVYIQKDVSFNPVESGLIMLSNNNYDDEGVMCFNPVESGLIMLSNWLRCCIIAGVMCFNPVESGLIMLSNFGGVGAGAELCFNPVESGLIMLSGNKNLSPP